MLNWEAVLFIILWRFAFSQMHFIYAYSWNANFPLDPAGYLRINMVSLPPHKWADRERRSDFPQRLTEGTARQQRKGTLFKCKLTMEMNKKAKENCRLFEYLYAIWHFYIWRGKESPALILPETATFRMPQLLGIDVKLVKQSTYLFILICPTSKTCYEENEFYRFFL